MSSLDQHIRHLAAQGVRIHIWPCAAGYQANVSEPGSNAWTCHTAADPVDALGVVLRQRCARVYDRDVVVEVPVEPPVEQSVEAEQQLDLEDFITAASADPFDEMFG